MVNVISVVGSSNSGKTTLVERIIPKLKEKGYRVGAIKHDAHRFEIDHEGKDSWRMARSGADTVVVSARDKMAVVKKVDAECTVDEIVRRQMHDMDIVIAEGYKAGDRPKIEVTRTERLTRAGDENLIAVVYNGDGESPASLRASAGGVPVFGFDDLGSITDLFESHIAATVGLS